MENRIENIIQELFALDPALKEHERQVRALLTQLLKSRPEVVVDADFARNLKERLLTIYPHAFAARPAAARWQSIFRPILAYPLAGIAVLVLIVGLLRSDTGGPAPLLQGGVVTRTLGSEAFGPLTLAEAGGKGGGSDSESIATAPQELSRPQEAPAAMAPQLFGMGGGVAPSSDAKMIAPVPPMEMMVYRYTYKGEPVDLPATLPVYRRAVGTGSGMDGLLQNLNLGLIDPNSFPNSKVQSLSFMNDDYSIFVNMTDGSVNINENWKRGMSYPEMRPLTQGDVPPDADLIALADDFIRTHGISREGYGDPFVLQQNFGPIIMEREVKGGASPEIYIPDVQQVIYPLILGDRPVFEEYGQRTGLTVSVNIRTRSVNGIYNLLTQEYEVSDYPAETDFGRIRKVLEQGGFRNFYPADLQARIVEVEVGEPEWGMVRVWTFNEENSRELFVPALIFPVKDRPSDSYPAERVIVPLVRSVLDQPVPTPMPTEPMPLMTPPDAPVSN